MKLLSKAAIRLFTRKMEKEDEQFYQQKQEVKNILEEKDILYDNCHKMDFYRSNQGLEYKIVIVDIHGGAWVYGDKKLNRHFCMHLASEGFPIFNINYTLVPDATVKQQIQEIFQALQYIIRHQKQFAIEGYKLCLSGDSAGAHLASLAAVISKRKDLQKLYEVEDKVTAIDCLLLQHGVYNLEPMKKSESFMMKTMYQWLFPKRDRALRDADSAWKYIDKSWDIPVFLLSSAQDQMFSVQTLQLADKLKELHCICQLLFWNEDYKELRHVFHIAFPDLEESKQSVRQMADFLKKISNSCDEGSDISSE